MTKSYWFSKWGPWIYLFIYLFVIVMEITTFIMKFIIFRGPSTNVSSDFMCSLGGNFRNGKFSGFKKISFLSCLLSFALTGKWKPSEWLLTPLPPITACKSCFLSYIMLSFAEILGLCRNGLHRTPSSCVWKSVSHNVDGFLVKAIHRCQDSLHGAPYSNSKAVFIHFSYLFPQVPFQLNVKRTHTMTRTAFCEDEMRSPQGHVVVIAP